MLVCFRKVQFMHVCLWLNHDHSDNYVMKLKFISGLVVTLNVYRAMLKLYVKPIHVLIAETFLIWLWRSHFLCTNSRSRQVVHSMCDRYIYGQTCLPVDNMKQKQGKQVCVVFSSVMHYLVFIILLCVTSFRPNASTSVCHGAWILYSRIPLLVS